MSSIDLIKTDSYGNEEWRQTLGGGDDDKGYSVFQTNDNGFIITGSTRSYGSGDVDVLLLKTDSDGNQEWMKTYGGITTDEGRSVLQTDNGKYVITGFTGSFGNGSRDVLLIKTDSEGNTEPYGN